VCVCVCVCVCACVCVCVCLCVILQTGCQIQSVCWGEALVTGSVYLSYSLQSDKETLCITRYEAASIKGDWISTISSRSTRSWDSSDAKRVRAAECI
jgi:hypothetical protein